MEGKALGDGSLMMPIEPVMDIFFELLDNFYATKNVTEADYREIIQASIFKMPTKIATTKHETFKPIVE